MHLKPFKRPKYSLMGGVRLKTRLILGTEPDTTLAPRGFRKQPPGSEFSARCSCNLEPSFFRFAPLY